MRIILDAYGGDNAPLEILKGAALAAEQFGVEVVLCGNEAALRSACAENGIAVNGFSFEQSPAGMPADADPAEILKGYADCSMAAGLRLLAKGGGDAFVSAGNTGALVVGASVITGRLKGINRAALGTVIPAADGCYMLLDIGANAECRPEMLLQFGIMGSVYMEKVMGTENPAVGLVNIGTEENKGLALQIEAGKLLKTAPVRYIGNVEARELPLSGCDVAVTDGFTGNIMLKMIEGMGKLMGIEMKRILTRNTVAKMAAAALMGGINEFRARMDYTEHGGAPLLGISKPVIKAHGSSNAKAIMNAVRQAKTVCESNVVGIVRDSLKKPSGE